MSAVAGYMRCSGKGQIAGDTFDRQYDSIRNCAQDKNFEVDKFFREEAVAGKTDAEDRPAFQEMVAWMMSEGCRTAIVESLDRLAREYRVQEQLIIYLASKGLSLIAANTGENITDAMMGDPMRRALVQVQGIFAELDKNLLIAKLQKARQRKRDKGERVEGRKPYGFHPHEVEVLARMKLMSAEHYTWTAIANELNEAGMMPRKGSKWFPATVGRILRRATGYVPRGDMNHIVPLPY